LKGIAADYATKFSCSGQYPMRKTRGAVRLFFALLIGAGAVRGDISPTQFIGSGIAARSESSVRMEKATVEIVWGTPCSLSATFKMVNSSEQPQTIRIGFPMPGGEDTPAPTKAPEDLTISFDGEAAVVTPPSASKEDRDTRRDWVWYHCQHSFKPGSTTVAVKTSLRASLVYATPFRESLFYCIQTGGNWAGNIGAEEVTIRFPHPVEPGQIISASPSSYEVEGSSVRWRFANFKPAAKEFDIALTYIRPDVMRTLVQLRRELWEHPDSSAAAVKLAKHLLVLGDAKTNSGLPPSKLSKDEHTTVAANITGAEEKRTFLEHYRATTDGQFEETSTEWTKERIRLIQILADAGYRDRTSQSPTVLEAERLLKNTLSRDPHNAEGWNVYLASYWRFSFAAVGHWFGSTCLSQAQAEAIETAAKNCSDDECIKLWLALRNSPPEKREKAELFEAIKRRGFMAIDFPKIEYGYY
jgi:hypothetical protein